MQWKFIGKKSDMDNSGTISFTFAQSIPLKHGVFGRWKYNPGKLFRQTPKITMLMD